MGRRHKGQSEFAARARHQTPWPEPGRRSFRARRPHRRRARRWLAHLRVRRAMAPRMAPRSQPVLSPPARSFRAGLHRASQTPGGGRLMPGGGGVPVIWVVASHRTLGIEHGQPQMYTVMDEAGTRTLLNMGLQPATFPGVPPERIPALLEGVDGVMLGGSATHVHPSLCGEPEEAEVPCYDVDRDAVALPLIREALER